MSGHKCTCSVGYICIRGYPHSALQLANRLPVKLGPLPSPRPPPSARQSASQTPPPSLLLYSQTKGVKQKYILCISGLVVYRQYIHNCSSQVDPHLARGNESSIRSSASLTWLHPPGWPQLQFSAAEPG